jgi:hypothetical protein
VLHCANFVFIVKTTHKKVCGARTTAQPLHSTRAFLAHNQHGIRTGFARIAQLFDSPHKGHDMTASLLQDDWLGDIARSSRVIHADFAQSNPEILEAVVHEVVQPAHEDCDNLAQFAQDFAQPAQPSAQPAQDEWFTAQQIADRYPDLGKGGKPLQEGAIRTRWWDWVGQVCSASLLKDARGFTSLASDLFDDFATHCKYGSTKPADWVQDAKIRFGDRLHQTGNTNLPSQVGGVLALADQRISTQTIELSDRQTRILDLIGQARSAESSLTGKQRDLARQRGQQQALEEFEVELETKLETLSTLRQKLYE